jgi:hypothetical protein
VDMLRGQSWASTGEAGAAFTYITNGKALLSAEVFTGRIRPADYSVGYLCKIGLALNVASF